MGKVDQKRADECLEDGLRFLARIIARDFMAKNVLNGDCKSADKNDEHIRDE